MREEWRRVTSLYVLPLLALGLLAWVLTTNPPPAVVIIFVAMLGIPLLGVARIEGCLEGLRYAKERVEAEMGGDRK